MKKNNENYIQIPYSLLCDKNLTDQDKLTLGLILSWFRNNKECFMGNEYIAEKMGITKNAASIRLQKLEDLGCIKLNYVLKQGKKEVEKRYITLLSLTPKVSSRRRGGIVKETKGIVSQTKRYRPVDEEVSCKQGGIKEDVLNNLKEKVSNTLSNNVLNKEILKQSLNKLNLPEKIVEFFFLYMDGATTKEQRNKLLEFKTQIEKVPALNEVIKNLY